MFSHMGKNIELEFSIQKIARKQRQRIESQGSRSNHFLCFFLGRVEYRAVDQHGSIPVKLGVAADSMPAVRINLHFWKQIGLRAPIRRPEQLSSLVQDVLKVRTAES